jgi:hypothetical protein
LYRYLSEDEVAEIEKAREAALAAGIPKVRFSVLLNSGSLGWVSARTTPPTPSFFLPAAQEPTSGLVERQRS